jgi:hypothetical protein
MKKSVLFWSFVMLAFFPAYLCAQEIKEKITSPTVEILGPLAAAKKAFLNDFGPGHEPIEWINTNIIFNDNEWQQSINVEKQEVYKYAFHMRTDNGSILDAVYTSDGKRLSSREYLKNFRPPLNIILALQNTEFKDWRLKNTFQVIKVFSTGLEKERYALVMKKGKEKKTIFFDENSRMLAAKSGEHGELADLDW